MPYITGCGRAADQNAGTVGEVIGENVTDFAKGVGKGIDNKLQISTELSPALSEQGVTMTVAKQGPLQTGDENAKTISVYCLAARALEATLIARAYNVDDQEIGRAKANVKFADDDAQYVTFSFPPEMDRQLVTKYMFDIGKPQSETPSAEADAQSASDAKHNKTEPAEVPEKR
ncbi:MAG: hypothetical protein H7Z17_04735 [Fuerstia sp.]|nr:hypothetical protein [Fuerstiella sp.]